jgi:hypothetical protein
MKKIVAWPITWALFWIGHVLSKLMELSDDGLPWRLYPAYNKLMTYSFIVQIWGGLKSPWKESK